MTNPLFTSCRSSRSSPVAKGSSTTHAAHNLLPRPFLQRSSPREIPYRPAHVWPADLIAYPILVAQPLPPDAIAWPHSCMQPGSTTRFGPDIYDHLLRSPREHSQLFPHVFLHGFTDSLLAAVLLTLFLVHPYRYLVFSWEHVLFFSSSSCPSSMPSFSSAGQPLSHYHAIGWLIRLVIFFSSFRHKLYFPIGANNVKPADHRFIGHRVPRLSLIRTWQVNKLPSGSSAYVGTGRRGVCCPPTVGTTSLAFALKMRIVLG